MVSNLGLRRGWVAWLDRDSVPEDSTEHMLAAGRPEVYSSGVCGYPAHVNLEMLFI